LSELRANAKPPTSSSLWTAPASRPGARRLYPDYKANRTLDTSTWIIAAATEWHRQGWWVEDVVGYEADDIIATIGLRAITRPDTEVFVLSGDSDVLPLTAQGIRVIKPVSGGQFTTLASDQVCSKNGITTPTALVELKAMTGESGDNVPGVTGIGDVRALALLTAHGDLEGVIAAGLRNVCKYSTMVAAAANLARLSRRLVTLATDAPIVKISPAGCAL
jgi:DNA polymerase-1